MTTYFLDMPNIELEMFGRKAKQLDKKEAELNQLEKDLNRRERSVNRREQELKKVSPQVWKEAKKAKKKAEKKALKTALNNTDDNIMNLSAKTANTNESVVVNTASMPGSDDTVTSSIGSIIMIVAAILLCATSAVFYRKHLK